MEIFKIRFSLKTKTINWKYNCSCRPILDGLGLNWLILVGADDSDPAKRVRATGSHWFSVVLSWFTFYRYFGRFWLIQAGFIFYRQHYKFKAIVQVELHAIAISIHFNYAWLSQSHLGYIGWHVPWATVKTPAAEHCDPRTVPPHSWTCKWENCFNLYSPNMIIFISPSPSFILHFSTKFQSVSTNMFSVLIFTIYSTIWLHAQFLIVCNKASVLFYGWCVFCFICFICLCFF